MQGRTAAPVRLQQLLHSDAALPETAPHKHRVLRPAPRSQIHLRSAPTRNRSAPAWHLPRTRPHRTPAGAPRFMRLMRVDQLSPVLRPPSAFIRQRSPKCPQNSRRPSTTGENLTHLSPAYSSSCPHTADNPSSSFRPLPHNKRSGRISIA